MSRAWTTGEVRRLAQMREKGTPYKVIAKALGRTVNACHAATYFHVPHLKGAEKGPRFDEKRDELLTLYRRRLTGLEIARRLGVSVRAVRMWLAGLGLKWPRVPEARRRRAISKSVRRAIRKGRHPEKNIQNTRRDQCEALGWPEASSPRQVRVFEALLKCGPCSVDALARTLTLSRTGVRQHLRYLVAMAYAVVLRVHGRRRNDPKLAYMLTPLMIARHTPER